jgi:hypothetical protein
LEKEYGILLITGEDTNNIRKKNNEIAAENVVYSCKLEKFQILNNNL